MAGGAQYPIVNTLDRARGERASSPIRIATWNINRGVSTRGRGRMLRHMRSERNDVTAQRGLSDARGNLVELIDAVALRGVIFRAPTDVAFSIFREVQGRIDKLG